LQQGVQFLQKKVKGIAFCYDVSIFANMKKIARIFMLWTMLFAMLIASAGFMLVKHSCHSCGIREVSLFSTKACCASQYVKVKESPSSCCKLQAAEFSCTRWIKTGACCEMERAAHFEPQTLLPQSIKFRIDIVDAPQYVVPAYVYAAEILPANHDFILKFPPPGRLQGTSFLFFIQQLKIPFA